MSNSWNIDRTTRGVRLTLAGQLLAERARSTLDKVQDDLAQVRRLGRGEEGTLTVGFSGLVIFTELPAAIESYRRRYPKVELRLRELATSAQIGAFAGRNARPGISARRRCDRGNRDSHAAEGALCCGASGSSWPGAKTVPARRRFAQRAFHPFRAPHGSACLRPDHGLLREKRFPPQDRAGRAAMADPGAAGRGGAGRVSCSGVRFECDHARSGIPRRARTMQDHHRPGHQVRSGWSAAE